MDCAVLRADTNYYESSVYKSGRNPNQLERFEANLRAAHICLIITRPIKSSCLCAIHKYITVVGEWVPAAPRENPQDNMLAVTANDMHVIMI